MFAKNALDRVHTGFIGGTLNFITSKLNEGFTMSQRKIYSVTDLGCNYLLIWLLPHARNNTIAGIIVCQHNYFSKGVNLAGSVQAWVSQVILWAHLSFCCVDIVSRTNLCKKSAWQLHPIGDKAPPTASNFSEQNRQRNGGLSWWMSSKPHRSVQFSI